MEILSSFNLFNKKQNITSKKLSKRQPQMTMKLLEDKIFSLSIDSIRKSKPLEKNSSQLNLNEQLEECFQPNNREEKKFSKTNKISLSTAILKYEFEKRKKSKGFLQALFDNNLRKHSHKKNKTEFLVKEVKKQIKKKKIQNIVIEENDSHQIKEKKSNANYLNLNIEKINDQQKKPKTKTQFSNAKYFKNEKNLGELHQNLSFSFPNLSNLLISIPITTDNSKNTKEIEEKSKNSEKRNYESKANTIKSLILLQCKKPQAKYRDDDRK